MDTGAWWTAVREVSKSWIQLSMHVSKTDTRISGLSLLITYCVNLSTSDSWRRKRHPTPVLLPGESHGWRSLVGYSVGHDGVTERVHARTETKHFQL